MKECFQKLFHCKLNYSNLGRDTNRIFASQYTRGAFFFHSDRVQTVPFPNGWIPMPVSNVPEPLTNGTYEYIDIYIGKYRYVWRSPVISIPSQRYRVPKMHDGLDRFSGRRIERKNYPSPTRATRDHTDACEDSESSMARICWPGSLSSSPH